MSLAKLLVAVRDQLRSRMGLDASQCQIRPNGQPNPDCGDIFIAVHGNDKSGEEELELGIAKKLGVSCTITVRTSYLGDDQLGDEAYTKALVGIDALADKVEGLVHKRFEVMHAANQMIQDSSYKIIEPLRWTDTDAVPTIVRDDWFNPESTQNQGGAVGLVTVVRFGNARRKQPNSEFDPPTV